MRDYKKELSNHIMARRLCTETYNVYMGKLDQFLLWCTNNGVLPEDVEHAGLVEFLAQEGSISACGQRRAMLVNLYEFVLGQGYKLLGLPYAKKRVKVPESLSPEQIQAIFEVTPNPKQRLALKITYACGLRVSETVSIRIKDFRQKKNSTGENYYEVKITGKGIKERLIPVPNETMNEIISFIQKYKITDYLFKGQFKSAYSTKSMEIVFMRSKNKCGITVPGNIHLLRKSRATHLINGNMNDRNVMLMMGWENQKTINHYHKANTGAIKDSVDNIDKIICNSINKTLDIAPQLQTSSVA